jgi:acyl-CoA thioester hydrolase
MDFNLHMRNTAFLDKSADVRMVFFAAHGFPVDAFARERVGPVIMRDQVDYVREVGLLEELRVTLAMGGLAPDGSRFLMRNEFGLGDKALAARGTSTGGWLDLQGRKLVVPPSALLTALQLLQRTEAFRTLPSRH